MLMHHIGIVVIGKRHSGKTTLTQYFTMVKDGEYLNDDCVYIVDGNYIGFCMPLPLRSLINVNNLNSNQGCLGETIDSEGVLRTLYLPPNCIGFVPTIDYVIFPKYKENSKNGLVRLSKGETFHQIIQNIRAYHGMKNLYLDINKLVSSAICYSLEYSSCSIADELIISRNLE